MVHLSSEHPNGKLNKKDFRKMIAEALPKKDVTKMEKHVFRVYDTNRDGYIDFVEFMVVFHILSGKYCESLRYYSLWCFKIESLMRHYKLNSGRLRLCKSENMVLVPVYIKAAFRDYFVLSF